MKQPSVPLFDPQLERLFVAALIAEPSRHDQVDIGLDQLCDLQAKAAFQAFANVRSQGEWVTAATVRAELERTWYERAEPRPGETADLAWYDDLVDLPREVGEPPMAGWALAISDFSAARAATIAAAEPAPRAPLRGPRADNTEPVRLAESFRHWRYELEGEPTLVRWARAWWRYNGTRYVEHDDESLDRDLIGFLDVVVAPQRAQDGSVSLKRVTSKQKTIGEVRKAALNTFPVIEGGAPQWTVSADGNRDPVALAPCANGILDLHTRELLLKTPRLFSSTAIGTTWDPAAEAPLWKSFLTSLWDDDTDSIHALQQMFGYFLSSDTSYQKIFALIGLRRSGKGTIARVLRALLGADAVVNPTLDGLEETFGLQPLVGKTLAVIGDARLGGAREQPRVVERLLSISGEDALLINRKNTGMVNVRLRTRVLLLSNEVPRLHDTSGALASRFQIIKLSKCFLGNEDTALEGKLLAELPGIFRWAVDGYESLQEAGRFITPAASEESQESMLALSSPMTVFLEDCCETDPMRESEIDVVFLRYQEWCKQNGTDRPGSKQWFGRNLNTILPGLKQKRITRPDGRRIRYYVGLGLT